MLNKELTEEQLRKISHELQKLLYIELLKDNKTIPCTDVGIKLVNYLWSVAYEKVMKHKVKRKHKAYLKDGLNASTNTTKHS